ncbi:OPT/YSL family transporter [Scopulibacillus cellulosilyticus]|uniref:OPT/YSL family transporter n=1 Tax=Scopulibacillus cellulosilyticus TaxID=2665665 RepID=A0ABW2PWN7_9BACL
MKDHQKAFENPSVFTPAILFIVIIVSALGAIIGVQLITSLGISANTSIIGALLAMILARIPIKLFYRYKSIHTQNLVQTSISSATFGAGNSLMIPIGIPFIFGRTDLIMPMLIGASCALIVDAVILYRVFDSKIFPAEGTWAPGIATSEAIKAGDQGGKKAKFLGIGIAGGIIGQWLGIPMSAFGVAFIGNIIALTMFGIGLLFSGYSSSLFGLDINAIYLPQGVMIGAGLVALGQMVTMIIKSKKALAQSSKDSETAAAAEVVQSPAKHTRSEKDTTRAFGLGFVAYLIVALIIALMGGLISHMSIGMLIVFLLFAAFAAFCHEIIVGIAAMHSGWFPAFAVALITLIIGMLIGFPPVALALLVGFSAATGPAFTDMAYDFKTGYLLRGSGKDIKAELEGRKQQFKAGLLGFAVAIAVVAFTFHIYFAQGLVPPVDKVYVSTIKAGVSSHIALELLLWAIPGAILQLIGGSKRQMGVLFATGLLLMDPIAGWSVIAGILIRVIILKIYGKKAEPAMFTTAAGLIAGGALYSFFSSVFKLK